MNLSSGDYQVLYVKIVQKVPSLTNAFETPKDRAAYVALKPDNHYNRDLPPHPPSFRQFGPPPARLPPPHCFGCGEDRHYMMQCQVLRCMMGEDQSVLV